ncbi:MAG: NAD(P)/FAD-dependent oxidoreductase [Verrucomicrobia bacterium]|nr:NAD(P)/FAD-dependent oxidoreductase [Verrucomicrobiota bacterium]
MNRFKTREFSVVVIGAGAAGLIAGLVAARSGARVIVFEQLPEAGVRLLATGGGHCNFTNTLGAEDLIRRFGDKRRFAAPALRAMTGTRLRGFFEELGIASHSPDGFHVFPASDSARSIRNALLQACRKLSVEFRFNSRVEGLQIERGRMVGIETSLGTESASRVVLAAGGAGYPSLGGGESGFALARRAGHTIVPLCPALVPLVTREPWSGTLAGVTLPHVLVNMAFPGGTCTAGPGSLLFTHKGISGPVALDVSGAVASALMTRESVAVTMDLCPERPLEAWQGTVEGWRREHGAKTVLAMLGCLLPASLARVVLNLAQAPTDTKVSRLSREQIHRLIAMLTNLPLTVTGTEGFGKAMVTRGGVALGEVCPRTLESKIVRGLFFAGEILDVDGPCGGFNLQWAFSSGFLAAQ